MNVTTPTPTPKHPDIDFRRSVLQAITATIGKATPIPNQAERIAEINARCDDLKSGLKPLKSEIQTSTRGQVGNSDLCR